MQELAPIANAPTQSRQTLSPEHKARLLSAAKEFETAFVTEMLSAAGLGEMRDSFNGGAGEAAFSGFLIREYADKITETGRFGIADRVYAQLLDKAKA